MKKLLLVLLVAAFAVGLNAPLIQACGDKFLVSSNQMTRGRVQTHAGVILIIRTPETRTALDKDFMKSLERRGHIVEVIENTDDLENRVKKGKVDLVMLSLEDAEAMDSPSIHLELMPVVSSWIDVAQAKEVFKYALDGSGNTSKKADDIDDAMMKRAK